MAERWVCFVCAPKRPCLWDWPAPSTGRVPRFFITGGGLPCSRVSPFEPACFGTALPRAEGVRWERHVPTRQWSGGLDDIGGRNVSGLAHSVGVLPREGVCAAGCPLRRRGLLTTYETTPDASQRVVDCAGRSRTCCLELMRLARCRFSTALLLMAVFYDAGTARPARGYHELPAAVGFPRVPPVVMAAKGWKG